MQGAAAFIGTAVKISGGGGSLTYPGSITKDNAGRLVDIQNHSTGDM